MIDNHDHVVFRTPEPSLVAGMKWFLNAFTRHTSRTYRRRSQGLVGDQERKRAETIVR